MTTIVSTLLMVLGFMLSAMPTTVLAAEALPKSQKGSILFDAGSYIPEHAEGRMKGSEISRIAKLRREPNAARVFGLSMNEKELHSSSYLIVVLPGHQVVRFEREGTAGPMEPQNWVGKEPGNNGYIILSVVGTAVGGTIVKGTQNYSFFRAEGDAVTFLTEVKKIELRERNGGVK